MKNSIREQCTGKMVESRIVERSDIAQTSWQLRRGLSSSLQALTLVEQRLELREKEKALRSEEQLLASLQDKARP